MTAVSSYRLTLTGAYKYTNDVYAKLALNTSMHTNTLTQ